MFLTDGSQKCQSLQYQLSKKYFLTQTSSSFKWSSEIKYAIISLFATRHN